MSTFKITPEDLGRTALARDGKTYVIYKGDKDRYAYATHKGSCDSNGRMYYSDGTSPSDLVAWADDKPSDQLRPKDLRDEFAMVAMQMLYATDDMIQSTNEVAKKNGVGVVEVVANVAYKYADAMMKAREGKV